jgi:type II secretory pathway component PulF
VPLSQMLAASGIFDVEDVGLLQSGERAGTVPEGLNNLSCNYEQRLAAMRAAGRTTSTTIMVTFGLLLSVWIMCRLWSFYGDLAFKAADMMGGP